MVLDEKSTSDQFASAIDFPELPKGLPPFRKDVAFRHSLLRVLQKHAASVHRPLTPDETTALAYHTAKGMAISSWGLPIGSAIASYHMRDKNYCFPIIGTLKSEGVWLTESGFRSWEGNRLGAFMQGL